MRLDLVANILSMRAARGETLTIFGGEQWRPLLHVRDVSTAISHGLENGTTGLFNLSYRNYKICDLGEEVLKVMPECAIQYTNMKFEDLRNYKVKNNKILDTGWTPRYNLQDGISQILNLIKENRIKDTTDVIYSNAAYIRRLNDF